MDYQDAALSGLAIGTTIIIYMVVVPPSPLAGVGLGVLITSLVLTLLWAIHKIERKNK